MMHGCIQISQGHHYLGDLLVEPRDTSCDTPEQTETTEQPFSAYPTFAACACVSIKQKQREGREWRKRRRKIDR